MKSLFIYVLAIAGYMTYIQAQIAGTTADGNRNGILPVQITKEGIILNSLALMLFTEHKRMPIGSEKTGNCKRDRIQIDTHTETKARLRYLRSLTAKRSGLPGYISQPTEDPQQNFSPAADNAGASGQIYDTETGNRYPVQICYATQF